MSVILVFLVFLQFLKLPEERVPLRKSGSILLVSYDDDSESQSRQRIRVGLLSLRCLVMTLSNKEKRTSWQNQRKMSNTSIPLLTIASEPGAELSNFYLSRSVAE